MELNYIKNGDYYIPDLKLDETKDNYKINRYGLLKLDWLKENNKPLYTQLLMTGKLKNYLFAVSNEATDMLDNVLKSYAKNDVELTEKLKETNQMEWVQKMNNYKNLSEEFVLKELIYS